jgi:hypothetical protein
MPYVSDAQRRWAHTPTAKAAGFPTKEWDDKSRGLKLPERKAAKEPSGIPPRKFSRKRKFPTSSRSIGR